WTPRPRAPPPPPHTAPPPLTQKPSRLTPAVKRKPMKSASPSRSAGERERVSVAADSPRARWALCSCVDERFFQRAPLNVEWAPQPNPSQLPSLQYLTL